MREAHDLERAVGMEWYASETDGIGGRLRASDEEFRVRELERFETEPADADPGAYPHLVVRATLRGWDTNDFAKRLSDALRMSRERVSWAGTKDKHAVTTQLFSLFKVDPDELPAIDGAELEVLGRAGRSLEFGDLAGNEFEIGVRDAVHPERIDRITAELRAFGGGETDSVGVPNFFGQQRFGSYRPVTHRVGLAIVRGEWKDAVVAYVGNPSETEPEGTREARRSAEREIRGGSNGDDAPSNGPTDWGEILDALPRRLGFERSMVHKLVENGGTEPEHFREAIEELPWNLQRLFVNAAQSYVYNRILSERLERGLPFDRAVEGDVCCFADAGAPDGLVLPDTDRLQRATGARTRTLNRHVERGRAFVTAPLVGTETELATGEPGEIEREVLDDLDLAPGDFDLPGEFHSTGTRRAILLRTDLTVEDATFTFSLPKGSYATVVLREYLKTSPIEMG